MISFTIKTNNPKAIDFLFSRLCQTYFQNIIFAKRNFSKYTNIIFHYAGNNSEEFFQEISSIISSCILEIYEFNIIRDILFSEYFYFDMPDIKVIEKNCSEILYADDRYNNSSCHFSLNKYDYDFEKRKSTLFIAVLEYLQSNKSMILEGFIAFRLKEYMKYLEDVVDNAVYQFVIDKEYSDFIQLIKMYIESKKSKSDVVYLVYKNGNSTLLDKDNNIIQCDKMILNTNYLSDITFSSNDYTLNSLLYLLPNKLIITLLSPEDEFIATLKLIFDNKIIITKETHNKGLSSLTIY